MLWLSGCATVGSDPRLTTPDVVTYSRATQARAADEIQAGKCPVMTEMVKDYAIMRDQARVLRK